MEMRRGEAGIRRLTLGVGTLCLFAVPVFLWPGLTDYSYGKSIAALVAVALLTLVWGIRVWHEDDRTLRLPWIILPFALLVLASLASLSHAMNARVVVQSLALILAYAQIAGFVADNVRTKRDVELILFALLASGFAASVYGILQYTGTLPGATRFGGLDSLISFMGNRNYLGGYLVYVFFPSILLVFRLRSRSLRIASLVMLAVVLGTMILLQQTAVLIVLFGSAAVLAVAWLAFRPRSRPRNLSLWAIGLVAVLIVAAALYVATSPPTDTMPSSRTGGVIRALWEENSGPTRTWNWLVALQMLRNHPLTGVGLGHYKLNYVSESAALATSPRGETLAASLPRAAQAHNDYLQVAAEMGILGLIAVVGLLATLVLSLRRRIRRAGERTDQIDLLLLSGGLVAFLAHAAVSFPAHLPASSLAGVVILGLCLSRTYGGEATFNLRVSRPLLRILVVAAGLVSFLVAVLAVRDARADVLIGRGIAASRAGDPVMAEMWFEESLGLDFCPRQTYYYLANVEGIQGKIDEAMEHLELSLTRFTDQRVYLEYADVAGSLGRIDEARQIAEFVLDSQPPIATQMDARLLLVALDLLEGDTHRAAERLRSMISEHPSDPALYIRLGDLVTADGEVEEARSLYEKALAIVDEQTAIVEQRLASPTATTPAALLQFRSSLEQLGAQRSAIQSRLASLP